MTRYFFDTSDNGRVFRDEEGTELASLEVARQEALVTLSQIVKDKMPDGDRREFVIDVRDGDGPLLTASLSLRVERKP